MNPSVSPAPAGAEPERASHDREVLRTLIDSLPDSIYVKDAHGSYILDNVAHMRHIGMETTDEVVGKTVFDFFRARSRSVFMRMTRRSCARACRC